MADREKKRGRRKYKNLNIYLENENSFLDEIKNIFHGLWRAIIWLKIKNGWKIADTSFKVMGGKYVFCCWGHINFNPTSHLNGCSLIQLKEWSKVIK